MRKRQPETKGRNREWERKGSTRKEDYDRERTGKDKKRYREWRTQRLSEKRNAPDRGEEDERDGNI